MKSYGVKMHSYHVAMLSQPRPNEKINLIAKPEYENVTKQLATELFNWLESTGGMQIPLKKTTRHPWGDYRHLYQY